MKFSTEKVFFFRMENLLDDKRELPKDFLGELYKWALEC